MYHNEQSQVSVEKDLLNNPYVRWGLMLIGVAISFLVLDIMLRRPLLRELAMVKRDLASMQKGLHELVGAKDVAWESSNLLSALNVQKRQMESARSALNDLRDFRQSVELEAQKSSDAVATLERIGALQREASVSLKRVNDLHKQVAESSQKAEVAAVEVQKLGDLRTKVLENSAGVEDAQRRAAELIALKDSVVKTGDVASSQAAADKLLALRDSLRPADDSIEESQSHASKLLSLRDELASSAEDTQVARRNWDSVRKLESEMKAAGGDIAAAIETLELLTDLGQELRDQTQSLGNLRTSLVEIAMMETTIGRAMRVLEPLAQLKNLTRLSDTEIRAAARAILDQRTSVIGHREENGASRSITKLPHQDSLFQDEPLSLGERLVPEPRDLKLPEVPTAPIRTQAGE